MAEQKSTQDQIQTDPEVRDRIGEAIMSSIICTHDFAGTICETCWESTQRIGTALVMAFPALQITEATLTELSWRYQVHELQNQRRRFVDRIHELEAEVERQRRADAAWRASIAAAASARGDGEEPPTATSTGTRQPVGEKELAAARKVRKSIQAKRAAPTAVSSAVEGVGRDE